MNKQELYDSIQNDLKSSGINLTKTQVKTIFLIVFRNLGKEISLGRTITIESFGKFQSKYISRKISLIGNETKKIWEIKFYAAPFLKKKINM